jgi:hypothetical protein
MSDRFDLEQQIMDCWKITDDIRAVLDYSTPDNLNANLLALAQFTDVRFEKLWAIFEHMCVDRQFADMSRSKDS